MCPPVRIAADRRFKRRCQIIGCWCLVFYIVCSQLSLRFPHTPFSLVLAGLGGAFFFAEVVSLGFLVFRVRDEFQRILLTRSLVWATAVTMAISTVWGFVELRGHGAVPHLDIIWIPILLLCVTAAAKVLIFRQFKSPAE